jgi:hypothetical protein
VIVKNNTNLAKVGFLDLNGIDVDFAHLNMRGRRKEGCM